MSREKYSVNIGDKVVGPGNPIYIAAEIGINHNGDMGLAKKLIDLAVNSGCDAVKFQKRTIESVYTPQELAKPREVPLEYLEKAISRGALSEEDVKRIRETGVTTNGDQKRMLEFGEKEYKEIDKYCKEKGITWYASPWDLESVDFLDKFDVPAYKIASASLTDKDLLSKVKQKNKPVILSTGMSTSEQIKKAVDFFGEENLVLLSCVSTYPTTNLEDNNLKVIETFKKEYSCPVGYSGHEPDTFPTIMAMALGAEMIERHITLGRTMYGSDQAASLERKGLELICERAKDIPKILGDGVKRVTDSEKPILEKLRKVDNL